MRKSREAAADSRRRIVQAAAREFRARGIDGTSLADLMKAAGLTHGGFYKHFESKDQLVAEASAQAIAEVTERLEAQPTAAAAVAGYLSARHRDDPASGCLLAALGGELARADEPTRAVATAGFVRLVDLLAGKSGAADARRRGLVAAATIIGALTVARFVTDPELAAAILKEAEQSLTEG